MKKYIIITLIILIALTAAIIYQSKPSDSNKQVVRIESKELKIEKSQQSIEPIQIVSQDEEEIIQITKEFNLPQDLQEELIEASKEPVIEADEAITEEELQEAGISKSQIQTSAITSETENLTVGHSISDESFNEILSLDPDSETLADLALLAIAEGNDYQAEEAYQMLKDNYPDSEATEAVRLEYE